MANIALTSPNSQKLYSLIDSYFNYVEGEYHFEELPVKETGGEIRLRKKVYDREPEPATIAGFALFLGFNSKQEFDLYELKGRFRCIVKRAHLRIEALYEKKLHLPSPTGAIFALKSMGWTDKPESKIADDEAFRTITIEITERGPMPVENEQDVIL